VEDGDYMSTLFRVQGVLAEKDCNLRG
jgi:hypothetical protein